MKQFIRFSLVIFLMLSVIFTFGHPSFVIGDEDGGADGGGDGGGDGLVEKKHVHGKLLKPLVNPNAGMILQGGVEHGKP